MDPQIATTVAGLLAGVLAVGAQGGVFWDCRRVRRDGAPAERCGPGPIATLPSSRKMEQRLAWRVFALCLLLAAAACGDGKTGPTGPTTSVTPSGTDLPTVGGAYTGTISAWLNGQPIGTYPITMTVEQSGNRITVEGTIESDAILMDTASGTITAAGTFTADLADDDSEACGRRTNRSMEIRFTGGSADMKSSWQSEGCGDARFEATLSRV